MAGVLVRKVKSYEVGVDLFWGSGTPGNYPFRRWMRINLEGGPADDPVPAATHLEISFHDNIGPQVEGVLAASTHGIDYAMDYGEYGDLYHILQTEAPVYFNGLYDTWEVEQDPEEGYNPYAGTWYGFWKTRIHTGAEPLGEGFADAGPPKAKKTLTWAELLTKLEAMKVPFGRNWP